MVISGKKPIFATTNQNVKTAMRTIRLLLTLAAILTLSSCEKFYAEGTLTKGNGENGNVTITVSHHIQGDFDKGNALTRGENAPSTETPALDDICTRLSFAFFNGDEKVKTVNQSAGDDNYGTISLNLAEGSYRIVVIAHNGKGNCTISSPEKVKFYKNKMTDTFIYYGTLDVTEDDDTNQEIRLTRAVAKITLHISDNIPTNVKWLKFYYTGGSSTLDATTAQGCVNSKQTEELDIVAGQKDYSVYTFPHQDDKKVTLTVTAYDPSDTEVAAKRIEDIPVKRNYITTCTGSLFEGGEDTGVSTGGITLKFDPAWAGEEIYEF